MKIAIDQPRLLAALALALSVTDRRATMPVLANVLLHAHDEQVDITATDMIVTSSESLDCQVSARGQVTIDAKHLRNIVATLSGTITIELLDNDWVQVSAGRAVFKIHGRTAADFPELPETPGALHACDGAKLAALIDSTMFSVSTDAARVNLNGAWLGATGRELTMVSTDGHRLTKRTVELSETLEDTLTPAVIVPRKGLDEIRRALKRDSTKTALGTDGDHLFLDTPGLMLTVKLTNVTFPPWQQVVPKSYTKRAEIDRVSLVGALRSALVIAPEATSTVEMSLERDMLTLRADNPERGGTTQELPADYTGSSLRIGLNGTYALEALQVVDSERVWLEFNADLDPMVIRLPDNDGFIAVVMPMRI